MGLIERLNDLVWGIPTVVLILSVGIYLSVHTRFAQLQLLPRAAKKLWEDIHKNEKSRSSFQSLCTALAATVGTGNIAGVAGAITLGGPGSIFWMWVSALLGMMIKFSEALLSVIFRKQDSAGNWMAGPMHIMEKGLGKRWKPLAICYSVFGAVAAFGIGNGTQVNAVIACLDSMTAMFGNMPAVRLHLLAGGIMGCSAALILAGGFKRVGNAAELLVPVAATGYVALCVGALLFNYQEIPKAMISIIAGALQPKAVTGGIMGSAFVALRVGVSRGIFTNEAGMGTAAIAHGCADVEKPVEQGLMGIIEVFLDTLIICTMTALVILTSGVDIPYGIDTGAALTATAFAATYGPWVSVLLTVFLCFFAFATIIGWSYYGLECVRYLAGSKGTKIFIILQIFVSIFSAILETGIVWKFSEMMNGLMVLPNLLMLILLSRTVICQTREFIQAGHQKSASNKNLPKGNRWRHIRCRVHGSRESSHH